MKFSSIVQFEDGSTAYNLALHIECDTNQVAIREATMKAVQQEMIGTGQLTEDSDIYETLDIGYELIGVIIGHVENVFDSLAYDAADERFKPFDLMMDDSQIPLHKFSDEGTSIDGQHICVSRLGLSEILDSVMRVINKKGTPEFEYELDRLADTYEIYVKTQNN